jgi:hypothetical protein
MAARSSPAAGRTLRRKGGEFRVKKLLLLSLIAGAAAVAVQWPEIQRYMKIRAM